MDSTQKYVTSECDTPDDMDSIYLWEYIPCFTDIAFHGQDSSNPISCIQVTSIIT